MFGSSILYSDLTAITVETLEIIDESSVLAPE